MMQFPSRRLFLEGMPVLVAGVSVADLSGVDDPRQPVASKTETGRQMFSHVGRELSDLGRGKRVLEGEDRQSQPTGIR